MHMRPLLCLLLTIASCALSTHAGASVISADFRDPSDGLLTVDTASGLAWFQLEPTLNRSFFDVSSEFEPGGDFEGFRYATEQEFVTLANNAGILDFSLIPTHREEIIALQELVGISGVSGDTTFSLGIFSDPSTGSFSRRAATLFVTDTVGQVIFNNQPNGPAINLGSWLVREVNPIPEPSAAMLFLAGCLLSPVRPGREC